MTTNNNNNNNMEVTRFCVSVEQMVPYLENLRSFCDENDSDDGTGDHFDSEEDSGNASKKAASLPVDGDNSEPDNELLYPNEAIGGGREEELVNYVDLTECNPIVEACNCLQVDELDEGIEQNTILFLFRILY